jgi:hypothetical protein
MRRLLLIIAALSCLAFASTAQATVLLGDQHVEAIADGGSSPGSEAFGYTATSSGTAGSISVFLDSTGGITVGLYANGSGSRPAGRLATASNTSNTAHAWATIPIPAVTINSGTRYWIALGGKGGSISYRDKGNSGSNLDYSGTGFAAPYSRTGQWNSNPVSAYVSTASAPPVKPANTALPAISGTPQQGSTLTASQGTWTGTAPVSYSHLWSDGTTGSTDLLSASDVGQNVSVTVTATNSAGRTQATSSAVGPVTGTPSPPRPPVNTAVPAISGTAQQGATLTTDNGSWTNSPTSFTYQWQDDGTHNIAGATTASYTAQLSDVGHTLDVVVTATNAGGSAQATSLATQTVTASSGGMYSLPANRTYNWNPGLNAVGGIPNRTTISATLSPSGGDDTAAIQAALNNCPANSVVKLNAGVFHVSGQGLFMESACTLRGVGPGPGNWPVGMAASGTAGTYLEKPSGTSYPVITMGPQWGTTHAVGTPTNLTSDAVKGTRTATVASASGLSAGQLVIVNQTTNTNISHWQSPSDANNGWFEDVNRPVGDVLQIASVSGSTVTFTSDIPITYPVSQSSQLIPETQQANNAGVEDLYIYGGEGGDGGGGIHTWNCAHCWAKHIEASYNDEPINLDQSFGFELRDSYIHDAPGGLYNSSSSYGIAVNWYTSNSLFENNIDVRFDKVDVMRSAGGGNVFGYNYMDDGADLGGQFEETGVGTSHMTTPHYELIEGNQAFNFDQDDRWGNSAYITVFRNQLIGFNRDFSSYGPYRAIGITQWHSWQSFVGNVLGVSGAPHIAGYESNAKFSNYLWLLCYQKDDPTADGGKCLSTQLRDGNFDYLTNKTHWYGIGATDPAGTNGLTPPANSILPNSLYLTSKPAFFGSNPWPWADGSSAVNHLPGQLPARVRYDAGTPNTVQ